MDQQAACGGESTLTTRSRRRGPRRRVFTIRRRFPLMQSRAVRSILAGLTLIVLGTSTASAQVVVAGGLDFTNQYNFRGIRQNSEGVSIWPYVDLGIPLATGDGALKAVTLNLGTWNALHT